MVITHLLTGMILQVRSVDPKQIGIAIAISGEMLRLVREPAPRFINVSAMMYLINN